MRRGNVPGSQETTVVAVSHAGRLGDGLAVCSPNLSAQTQGGNVVSDTNRQWLNIAGVASVVFMLGVLAGQWLILPSNQIARDAQKLSSETARQCLADFSQHLKEDRAKQ